MVLQLVIAGVTLGAIYGLVAIGLIVVYNAVGLLNFAHAEFVVVGAYVAVVLTGVLGFSPVVGLAGALLAGALVGVVFAWTVFVPLREKPLLTGIIATIAVGLVLRNVARVTVGSGPFMIEPLAPMTPLRLGAATVLPQQVLVLAVTLVSIAALSYTLTSSRLGRAMRALSMDASAAAMIGVRDARVVTITFAISGVMAALAGVLITPLVFATPEAGLPLLLKSFAAAVVGGFGRIYGAVVGGVAIGLTEVFGAAYISSSFKDAFPFLLLIAFLVLRPRGLFGNDVGERV